LGLAVGLIAGPFLAAGGEESAFVRNTALSGAAGTAAGAGLGALAGSVFGGDHWQRFRVAPPRPTGCAAPPCAAPAPGTPSS
jgi:hypothetical protein